MQRLVLSLLMVCAWGSAAIACGDAETPCAAGDGTYHVALPGGETPPAVLWLHGYGGSGAKAVANAGFIAGFTDRGYAVIAANGVNEVNGEVARDWAVHDGLDTGRDEVIFLEAVIDDAVARFGLDPTRIYVAGFSRGGSMAWDFACRAPQRIVAVAAVAGGFWEPMTQDCQGPVHLFHTHGYKDGMVPLEGRKVSWKGVIFHQGNILKGLDRWRDTNGCWAAATSSVREDGLREKAWDSCQAGSILFHLTDGGHGIPRGWTSRVLDWFDALAAT